MATDSPARRTFRRSLLSSFALHVVVLLLLMALRHSISSYGPAGPLALTAGNSEPFPDAELLIGSDSPSRPDSTDTFTVDSDVLDSMIVTMPTVAIELRHLSDPDRRVEAPPKDEVELEQPSSLAGTSFFGTAAYGNQFVYVVDTSPSMNIGLGKGPGDVSRLVRALAELKASIQHLSPEQSFYVFLFNGQTRRMFDDNLAPPRAMPATPENKRRLDAWLASVRTGDSTDPRQALRLGLTMRPSALFLLSDGIFDVEEGTVLELIKQHNPGDTPIHAIAYEDDRSCQTMQRIAFATGGEYRFVPPSARIRER